MGSKFVILLYAPDEPTANRAFDAAFARIAALDQCLSDYESDSELTLLEQDGPHASAGSDQRRLMGRPVAGPADQRPIARRI